KAPPIFVNPPKQSEPRYVRRYIRLSAGRADGSGALALGSVTMGSAQPNGSGTMSYPIDQKLVIAIASSALFDLTDSDRVFREQGEKAYREYQQEHLEVPLEKGVA